MARSYIGCFEYRVGLVGHIPWYSGGRTRSDGGRKDIAGGVQDNVPTFVALLAGAAVSIQSGFYAVDQDGPRKGLGQESNGSGLQRSGADALVGKGRDENKRRIVTQSSLHIRNDT